MAGGGSSWWSLFRAFTGTESVGVGWARLLAASDEELVVDWFNEGEEDAVVQVYIKADPFPFDEQRNAERGSGYPLSDFSKYIDPNSVPETRTQPLMPDSSDDYLHKLTVDSPSKQTCKVIISDLKPATAYRIRLISKGFVTEHNGRPFMTTATGKDPFNDNYYINGMIAAEAAFAEEPQKFLDSTTRDSPEGPLHARNVIFDDAHNRFRCTLFENNKVIYVGCKGSSVAFETRITSSTPLVALCRSIQEIPNRLEKTLIFVGYDNGGRVALDFFLRFMDDHYLEDMPEILCITYAMPIMFARDNCTSISYKYQIRQVVHPKDPIVFFPHQPGDLYTSKLLWMVNPTGIVSPLYLEIKPDLVEGASFWIKNEGSVNKLLSELLSSKPRSSNTHSMSPGSSPSSSRPSSPASSPVGSPCCNTAVSQQNVLQGMIKVLYAPSDECDLKRPELFYRRTKYLSAADLKNHTTLAYTKGLLSLGCSAERSIAFGCLKPLIGSETRIMTSGANVKAVVHGKNLAYVKQMFIEVINHSKRAVESKKKGGMWRWKKSAKKPEDSGKAVADEEESELAGGEREDEGRNDLEEGDRVGSRIKMHITDASMYEIIGNVSITMLPRLYENFELRVWVMSEVGDCVMDNVPYFKFDKFKAVPRWAFEYEDMSLDKLFAHALRFSLLRDNTHTPTFPELQDFMQKLEAISTFFDDHNNQWLLRSLVLPVGLKKIYTDQKEYIKEQFDSKDLCDEEVYRNVYPWLQQSAMQLMQVRLGFAINSSSVVQGVKFASKVFLALGGVASVVTFGPAGFVIVSSSLSTFAFVDKVAHTIACSPSYKGKLEFVLGVFEPDNSRTMTKGQTAHFQELVICQKIEQYMKLNSRQVLSLGINEFATLFLDEWDSIFEDDSDGVHVMRLCAKPDMCTFAKLLWAIYNISHVRRILTETFVVQVIGPVNAGKSTLVRSLFNIKGVSCGLRLTDTTALKTGYTTDMCKWIRVVDTPGFTDTQSKGERLLPAANYILFVVPYDMGLRDAELVVRIAIVKASRIPFKLVFSKCDRLVDEMDSTEVEEWLVEQLESLSCIMRKIKEVILDMKMGSNGTGRTVGPRRGSSGGVTGTLSLMGPDHNALDNAFRDRINAYEWEISTGLEFLDTPFEKSDCLLASTRTKYRSQAIQTMMEEQCQQCGVLFTDGLRRELFSIWKEMGLCVPV